MEYLRLENNDLLYTDAISICKGNSISKLSKAKFIYDQDFDKKIRDVLLINCHLLVSISLIEINNEKWRQVCCLDSSSFILLIPY